MPDGLSYLGMRCILEYLEANKRIHITARSPVLQRFEKSIALHIDILEFIGRTTHLNDIEYDTTIRSGVYLDTRRGKKRSSLLIPAGIEANDVRKILFSKLLDGREDVYVNRLHFNFFSGLNLLTNLQLKIRKLDTDRFSFRDGYLNIVHPSSYPLMELRTGLKNIEDLDHDVLKSARKLVIPNLRRDHETWFIPSLTNLTNFEIEIQRMLPRDDETNYFGIIRNYLSVPRSIGSCLTFGGLPGEAFDRLLVAIESQLGVSKVAVKEPEWTRDTPFPIIINSTSTALVYKISLPLGIMFDVKIEVVPKDGVTPVRSN